MVATLSIVCPAYEEEEALPLFHAALAAAIEPLTAEFATQARVEELILMHFAPRYAGKYEVLLDEARQGFPNVSAEFIVD